MAGGLRKYTKQIKNNFCQSDFLARPLPKAVTNPFYQSNPQQNIKRRPSEPQFKIINFKKFIGADDTATHSVSVILNKTSQVIEYPFNNLACK